MAGLVGGKMLDAREEIRAVGDVGLTCSERTGGGGEEGAGSRAISFEGAHERSPRKKMAEISQA
jgi:hypothetical protein